MPLTKLEFEHLSPKTYESASPTEPLWLHTDMIKCGVIIACKRDTDTYIHIHTYIHTYAYNTCMCMYVHVYVCIHLYQLVSLVCAYIRMYWYVSDCICMYLHICACMHILDAVQGSTKNPVLLEITGG